MRRSRVAANWLGHGTPSPDTCVCCDTSQAMWFYCMHHFLMTVGCRAPGGWPFQRAVQIPFSVRTLHRQLDGQPIYLEAASG